MESEMQELLDRIEHLENVVERLKKENERLTEKVYADQAQIVYQRRQIDFLMEGRK